MSAPQLTDPGTSSEWFRTVAHGASEKPRSPSQAAIAVSARPKRFVRLATYTMVGLVAFTLLGVVSFAVRQRAMQSALAAPTPALAVVAPATSPATGTDPATLAEAPAPANSSVDAAPPVAKKGAATAAKSAKPNKAAKKTAARSPFSSHR